MGTGLGAASMALDTDSCFHRSDGQQLGPMLMLQLRVSLLLLLPLRYLARAANVSCAALGPVDKVYTRLNLRHAGFAPSATRSCDSKSAMRSSVCTAEH